MMAVDVLNWNSQASPPAPDVAFKQRSRPNGSTGHSCTYGRSFPVGGNSKCQGLAARSCLVHLRTRKVFVVGAAK